MLVSSIGLFSNSINYKITNFTKKNISFDAKKPRVDFDELDRLEKQAVERARELFPDSKIPDPTPHREKKEIKKRPAGMPESD